MDFSTSKAIYDSACSFTRSYCSFNEAYFRNGSVQSYTLSVFTVRFAPAAVILIENGGDLCYLCL